MMASVVRREPSGSVNAGMLTQRNSFDIVSVLESAKINFLMT